MSMEIKDELLDIGGIKSSNKNLLELFIRRTAVITSTQESLVEKIVKDQWNRANKITQVETDISEIDFCNLGTFYISSAKSKRRIKKLQEITKNTGNDPEMDDKKKISIARINDDMIKSIKFKTKQTDEN